MRLHTVWLVMTLVPLLVTIARAETKKPARAPLRICVVQPNTDRLVHFASVTIAASDTAWRTLHRGRTGLTGSPYVVEQDALPESVDSSLMVTVAKRGVQGSVRIVYDSEAEGWAPEFDYRFDEVRGKWSKKRLYEYDQDTDQWIRRSKLSASEKKSGFPPMNIMLPNQLILPTWQDNRWGWADDSSCCR